MNTPVNFEIGKLLRDNKQNISSSKLMYASNGKLTDAIYDFDDWCFAPTIAEVLMWFYEKHNIWISVIKDMNIKWSNDYFNYHIYSSNGIIKSDIGGTKPNTPKEAYSDAIKYILINKIIKK